MKHYYISNNCLVTPFTWRDLDILCLQGLSHGLWGKVPLTFDPHCLIFLELNILPSMKKLPHGVTEILHPESQNHILRDHCDLDLWSTKSKQFLLPPASLRPSELSWKVVDVRGTTEWEWDEQTTWKQYAPGSGCHQVRGHDDRSTVQIL